jgi:hypothetical protein
MKKLNNIDIGNLSRDWLSSFPDVKTAVDRLPEGSYQLNTLLREIYKTGIEHGRNQVLDLIK